MSASIHSEATLPAHINAETLAAPWVVDHMRKRWTLVAGITGAIAVALCVMAYNTGAYEARQHVFRAYLLGFIFCFGLTLGSLGLLMLQHVTGGKWGLVIRRLLEAGTRNLGLLALMFVPLGFGLVYLYPWAAAHAGLITLNEAGEHALRVRGAYTTQSGFILRAAIYFLGWGIFTYFFNQWTKLQDVAPESPEAADRLRLRFMRLGGGGLLFYAISVSLASIDWVMSLDATWFSTIWGMMYMAGQALLAMAFMIVVLVLLAKYAPMKSLLRKTELHDNGKLLLAFVMLYTYLSFSQFIIIWSGNLAEEIPWYLSRYRGGWKPVLMALVIFHFVAPFLLLLNRNLKKHGARLAAIAWMLVLARAVDMFWHIMPTFNDSNPLAKAANGQAGHFFITPMDIVVPLAMASLWVAMFFHQLKKRPVLPVYHPLLPEILEQSHGTH